MKIANLLNSFKSQPPAFEFTGNCPVNERTADGISVGRCFHNTYEHVCPRHGHLERIGDEPVDENNLAPLTERDYGSSALRKFLEAQYGPAWYRKT